MRIQRDATEASVRPPNSLIFIIGDPTLGLPEQFDGLVAATPGVVAVGTTVDADGPTMVRLRYQPMDAQELPIVAFDGEVATPAKWLAVESVVGDRYLACPTGGVTTHLRVTVDHPSEPAVIDIRATPGDGFE